MILHRIAIVLAALSWPVSPGLAQSTAASPIAAPTPLADTASSAPRLENATAAGRIELPAGATSVQVENRVGPARPTVYLFLAPAGEMVTVGVSSPKGDVRVAVFLAGEKEPVPGAGFKDGAIRWVSSFDRETDLRFVAYGAAADTPFRFAVTTKPTSL